MNFRIVRRTLGFAVLSAVVLLAVSSCSQAGSSTPVSTIMWKQDSSGSIEFSTNDASYYNYYLVDPLTQETQNTMTTVSAKVDKVSGAANVGFGLVFCYQDIKNYYAVLIDAQGQYTFIKSVSGTVTTLIKFNTPTTATLNSGLGASNVITVSLNSSTNTFTIGFNGTTETTYTDNSFTGGEAGFYAVVGSSSDENFPAHPETIQYSMLKPAAYS